MNLSKPRTSVTRVEFDPALALHRQAAHDFLQTGQWGDLQFYLELPFTEIPAMIKHRLAEYFLLREFSNDAESNN